jgi:hypothetical protein
MSCPFSCSLSRQMVCGDMPGELEVKIGGHPTSGFVHMEKAAGAGAMAFGVCERADPDEEEIEVFRRDGFTEVRGRLGVL